MSDRATLDAQEGVAALRADISALRAEIRGDIQTLRADLQTLRNNDLVTLRTDLRIEIRDTARNTMQWLFTTIITVTLFMIGVMVTLHVIKPVVEVVHHQGVVKQSP